MSTTQISVPEEVPKINQHLVDKCPECASKNLVHDYDSGETICGDCGLVVYEQMMDNGLSGALLRRKRKPQEAALACPHHIQFMIKDYLQPLVKLTEMPSEENSHYPQGYKCGVLGNGKYAAEYILPSTETWLKQWLNLNVYRAKFLFQRQ